MSRTGLPIPDFLDARLLAYEEASIKTRKNGKPLVLGKKPQPESIILQSNDYLSISSHPQVLQAQIARLEQGRHEMVMSAVFLHEDSDKSLFENAMAGFAGFEHAILCQSGWAANVGIMQTIADQNTPVYIDFFTHMSLWEGVKTSGAPFYTFMHNDAAHLENLVKQHGQGIIVVDALYSTTGDIAPLTEIIDIANRHNCLSLVDESHSLGTHGPRGAGLVASLGLTDRVHFITGSLAKAFAGRAGIILCSKRFADYYPYAAFPAIFSSALLPHEIAGLSATLNVIINSDDRRKKLHDNALFFLNGLESLGYFLASQSQIISLEPGSEPQMEILRDALEDRNVFGSVFCAPATPKNRTLMRFSLNSDMEINELQQVLDVCASIRDEVGMREWKSTKRKKT
ncbi:quorum-sensing autoinducer synthase [Chlorobium sp. BLA1]|uniref:alpha-hydroxyketone-type quorum-sensing autoinducer synthase n=1 Tax=Candidatus Chlorobium masyuteum TaxID=2716876 RepID=UPI00141EA757|nr:alpha-hydroxyketone-type quorum-sensing autoinducer synthase [Candidatus Chlorobium masyuteum]NHQ59979.1 quorum-sensing autoinducer synthase [Candidatus Chlorobium masyuteum]NTU44824.1 quorum-sensing autoinducer synthase [Chlorobiaceae bacterium]